AAPLVRGQGHAPAPLHALQQVPAQRPQEPHGLLRAVALRQQSRRDDRKPHPRLSTQAGAGPAGRGIGAGLEVAHMPRELPVTDVQSGYQRMALVRQISFFLIVLIVVLGFAALALAAYGALRFNIMYGRSHADPQQQFKYGSIGSELANGLPYKLLMALP